QKKDRHLLPVDRVAGAIQRRLGLATARYGQAGELLDPGVEDSPAAGHVVEDGPGARGRHVILAELRLEQEHRHLSPRDRAVAAEEAGSAAGRDSVPDELLDVRMQKIGLGDIE